MKMRQLAKGQDISKLNAGPRRRFLLITATPNIWNANQTAVPAPAEAGS